MPLAIGPRNAFPDGQAASGTVYSVKADCRSMVNASYQLFWTGTVAGNFEVWVSNKLVPNEANDSDWTLLQLASPINQPAGAAGNDFVNLNFITWKWMRVKYVHTTGSGTIEAHTVAKEN
jgi:hypothetical protein